MPLAALAQEGRALPTQATYYRWRDHVKLATNDCVEQLCPVIERSKLCVVQELEACVCRAQTAHPKAQRHEREKETSS